jgi:uncharacterized Zn-finger protein
MPRTTETAIIDSTKVACNGDKDSPHPRVYLAVSADGVALCPYCGKRFVLTEEAHHRSTH